MGASAGDVEDDLSVDEGRRIIGDVPGPSDLEMGLADGGDDPTTVEDGEGKTCQPSTSLGDVESDCRYCLLSDAPANLIAPCSCDGTLRWCHYKCLEHWVQEKRALICEICGQPYAESIRSELVHTVAQAEKLEQERRDAALAAELEGGANQRTGLPTMDRPVARMWCRIIVLIVITFALLYVVLFLSKGTHFSFWTLMLLRVLSFVLPFYLIGRGIIALQRYRQER